MMELNMALDFTHSSGTETPGTDLPTTLPAVKPSSRRAHWARVAVGAFFLANGAGVGSWVPHIPDKARELHLNTAQLGGVLLVSGGGAMLAMPLAGWLTTRYGSRRVSGVAACLFPLALVVVVLAPTTLLIAVALFCMGLASAIMDVAMNSQAIAVEEGLRRRTMSLFHGMWSIGGFAGAAVTSTLLAHRIPSRTIVIATAAALICLAVAANPWMLSRAEEGVSEHPHALRPTGRLLMLGLLAFVAMLSEGSIADWSGIYLRLVRGLGPGLVGFGYAAFAAAMVVGRMTGDRVVQKSGEMRALLAGGLLAAAGLLAVLTLGGHPLGLVWSMAGFALVGLGLANASPILYRAAGQVPGVAPGAGIATAVGIGYAGFLAGPPSLGFLGHEAGVSLIFVAVIVLCCLLAIASPLVRVAERPSGL
jgi:MFS family permease